MKFVLFVFSSFMMTAMTNAGRGMKRQNIADVTVPIPLINTINSNLFQLSNFSSMWYPAITNTTFNIFHSLNPLFTGNPTNGLCTPQGITLPTATPPVAMIPTKSPIGSNPSDLLAFLENGSGSSALLGGLLIGLLGGNSSNPGSSSNPKDPLAFLRGVTGTNGYNGTFNLSPATFTQLLSSIGQTPLSLQVALQVLGISPTQFVNGLTGAISTLASYLQGLFTQAAGNSGAGESLVDLINPLLTSIGKILGHLG